MEKEITFKPSFNFNDYLKINYSLLFKKVSFSIVFIICILTITANVIFNTVNANDFIDFLSFPILISLLVPLIMVWLPYKSTKMILSDPKLKENIIIIINRTGIEYIGQSFQNKYEWKDFSKITENKKWYILQLNKKQEIIIQKKDMNTNQQLDLKEIIEFVKN
ncbi:YcxB family protein [Paenimyroides aestuarii]|uniref:YcxB family protein n=1 Tax=Paenimyroides aestuarii TaxID=2968490 RepID=A0ABY5NU02_9FLAO|nr:YcxB family protein [Paenimyroides aestuarii]UUV21934.1 YcxB family protein [Paenimyroides aestuarii]